MILFIKNHAVSCQIEVSKHEYAHKYSDPKNLQMPIIIANS